MATFTVQALRTIIARFGVLESIYSPQFVAAVFQAFCAANGIHQIRVSNCLAERAVRIFKGVLKK